MKYSICTMIKDEQMYLEEWIRFYIDMGFENITLYEDFESTSHKEICDKYDKVVLIPLDGNDFGIINHHSTVTQGDVYKYFLDKVKKSHEYDWVLFIDVDEFLMFDEGYDIDKLTEEFKNYGGVYLCWKLFNANGHVKRPEGTVFENYTTSLDGAVLNENNQWNIKTFANIAKCDKFIHIHAINNGVHTNYNPSIHAPMNYEKAWLNHYFTKSFEDYCYRMFKKGNMSNNLRSFDDFFDVNPDFKDKEMELLEEARKHHCNATMFISRKHGLISGGNLGTIQELNNRINN